MNDSIEKIAEAVEGIAAWLKQRFGPNTPEALEADTLDGLAGRLRALASPGGGEWVMVPDGEENECDVPGCGEYEPHIHANEDARCYLDAKPDAWWNGQRPTQHDDLCAPSINWEREDTSHDIPLFSGFNTQGPVIKVLNEYKARALKAEAMLAAAPQPQESSLTGVVARCAELEEIAALRKDAYELTKSAAEDFKRRAETAEARYAEYATEIRLLRDVMTSDELLLMKKARVATSRAETAETELAQCRADAERYRWLRDQFETYIDAAMRQGRES